MARFLASVLAADLLARSQLASAALLTHRARNNDAQAPAPAPAPEGCPDGACRDHREDAADRIRQYGWQLALESRKSISVAAAELVSKRNASLEVWNTDRQLELTRYSERQRDQALAAERAWLENQTAHNDTLKLVAEYRMMRWAFSAMQSEFRKSSSWQKLNQNATRLREVYRNLSRDWDAADAESLLAFETGKQQWENSSLRITQDVSWLAEAVGLVNSLAGAVVQPFQDANWTKHAVRLASDLAELANARVQKVETQVHEAEDQARRAQKATQTNLDRLEQLETMVAEAEAVSLNNR